MYNALKKASDLLSSKASIFIILTAVITYLAQTYINVSNKADSILINTSDAEAKFEGLQLFGWVNGNTQTIILGIIMLTMGLTLTPQDFWQSAPWTSSSVLWRSSPSCPLWHSVFHCSSVSSQPFSSMPLPWL